MKNSQKYFLLLVVLLFFIAAPFGTANAQLCTPTGTEGPLGDASCSDAVDNDCDGLIDAADGARKKVDPADTHQCAFYCVSHHL